MPFGLKSTRLPGVGTAVWFAHTASLTYGDCLQVGGMAQHSSLVQAGPLHVDDAKKAMTDTLTSVHSDTTVSAPITIGHTLAFPGTHAATTNEPSSGAAHGAKIVS